MFPSVEEQIWARYSTERLTRRARKGEKEELPWNLGFLRYVDKCKCYLEWQWEKSLRQIQADNESLETGGRYERTEKSLGGEEEVDK